MIIRDGTSDLPRGEPIFVFGSNNRGIHGAGSALAARRYYGAVIGVGNGMSGRSYGIPTCAYNDLYPTITPLTREEVERHIGEFAAYARDHSDFVFMMSKVGTGSGGFSGEDIRAMLIGCPNNVDMPMDWNEDMGREPLDFSLYAELCPLDITLGKKCIFTPLVSGFSLTGSSGIPIEFSYNTDRSRVQNWHEALVSKIV